jgi:hypothetical protein
MNKKDLLRDYFKKDDAQTEGLKFINDLFFLNDSLY